MFPTWLRARTEQHPKKFAPRSEALEDRMMLDAGGLDPAFSGDGKTTNNFTGGLDEVRGMAIQPDGKIVVAGRVDIVGNMDFGLARYNTDGTLDSTFGNQGQFAIDFVGGHDEAFDLAIQDDGKIVVVGFSTSGGNQSSALARFDPATNALDPTFGTGGKVISGFGGQDRAVGVALQKNDGKIVVAATNHIGANQDFVVARFLSSNGTLDPTFGSGGWVSTDFSGNTDVATDLAIQDDGKIVVVGKATVGVETDFALARYESDGDLDTQFGTGGKVTTDVAFVGTSIDEANAVAIQDDGKIVVVGYTTLGTGNFALVRYDEDGTKDFNFGSLGVVNLEFEGGVDYAEDVAVQSDGKIVVVGKADVGGVAQFGLARLNSGGTLDASFGTGGKVATNVGGAASYANAVAIQQNGKIVAAGYSNLNGGDFALARYDAVDKQKPPAPTPSPIQDVSGQVLVLGGRLRRTRPRGRYRQQVTLVNVGGAALEGPLYLALDGLSRRARLRGPDGFTRALAPLGSPLRFVNPGTLGAGQSLTLTLEFAGTLARRISYTPRVLTGVGMP